MRERQSIRGASARAYYASMTNTERQQYKIVGPATWDLIRAQYLEGDSARALAERFGVSEYAIRKRIWIEKWSKRDYALALEARGLSRGSQKRNFIEEGVLREEMRAAEHEESAPEREAEMNALVEQIASEEDAAGIAAALERRALAQASAAMVQGRSKEAQALASMAEMMRKRTMVAVPPMTPLVMQREAATVSPAELERRALAQAGEALARGDASEARALTAVAEQMRKRVEDESAAEIAAKEEAEACADDRENHVLEIFRLAAHVASAMVHQPTTSPAVFLQMVKRWREINLGEGEADAEKRAAVIAAALARHIEGRSDENMPEDVRAYLAARWDETRRRLGTGEPVGVERRHAPARAEQA